MIDASVIQTDSFTVSFKFEDIAQNICLDVILKAIRDLGVNPPDVDLCSGILHLVGKVADGFPLGVSGYIDPVGLHSLVGR